MEIFFTYLLNFISYYASFYFIISENAFFFSKYDTILFEKIKKEIYYEVKSFSTL